MKGEGHKSKRDENIAEGMSKKSLYEALNFVQLMC